MSPTSLGARLKELRQARRLTQDAVANAVGINRASIAQWEGDRHLPSPENVRKLDELYDAMGELAALAHEVRSGHAGAAVRSRNLDYVFGTVADALVAALRTDKGAIGWSHNLVDERPAPVVRPTALSSAFVVRTLQLLDDARVDLHAVGEWILSSRLADGTWSHRPGLKSRPEATATILAALARMGMLADVPAAVRQLQVSVGDFSRSRPYVLTVVLEAVLNIEPGHPFVEELVDVLLAARTRHDGKLVWATKVDARTDLIQPSLPNTARAVAILRAVHSSRPAVVQAIDEGIDWIVGRTLPDDGVDEDLEPDPDKPSEIIRIHHFSAPWVARALIGREDVPPHRLARSVSTVWENFDSARENLWCWRSDVTFPSWMTLDAVFALRAAAHAAFPTPLPPKQENDLASAPHDGER